MISIVAQLAPLFTNAGLAAAGVATIAVPIAIHLLTRMRRQRLLFGAMRFLMLAYRKHRKWMRLEQWLLLAVRCLILIMLGLALSGPMLSGCAGRLAGGFDSTGRTVYLVIDTSLSTRANLDNNTTRFDQLKQAGEKVIAELEPTDELSLWRAARPAAPIINSPTLDHKSVTRAVNSLQPDFSRADIPGVFALVVDDLLQRQLPPDRVLVVVLSDFAGDSLDINRPTNPELTELASLAKLLLVKPMPTSDNVQVKTLSSPRYSLVQHGGAASASVSLELSLRRFGSMPDGEVTSTTLAVADDNGNVFARARRDYTWPGGQIDARLTVDLPLTDSPPGRGSQMLNVTAALTPLAGTDSLVVDNKRHLVIELKDHLTVGLINGQISSYSGNPAAGFSPRTWLRLALNPSADSQLAVQTLDLSLATLNEQSVKGLDAVMIVRPDLLDSAQWQMLADYASKGGQLWVFAPAIDTPSPWGQTFNEKVINQWQIGLEPVGQPADEDDNNQSNAGWQIDENTSTPDPLALLAADWKVLLRPVKVYRRLDLQIRDAANGAWLSLDDPGHTPLMAARALGQGYIVFLSTALDTRWTNLVTKPLFVPLVHESLHGLLGQAGGFEKLNAIVCGDQPVLDIRFEGAQRLINTTGDVTMLLKRMDAGLTPVEAFNQPGIYQPQSPSGERSPHLLPVNIDAAAGDTRTLDPEILEQWLSPVGNWQWLDISNPGKTLAAQTPRTNIGWMLLWVTLALVFIETTLAYYFSHGTTAGSAWLGGSLIGKLVTSLKGEAA